jgi:hypothetical protein
LNGPAEIDLSLARIRAARVDGIGLVVGRRAAPGDGWFSVEELLSDDSGPATLLAMVRGISEIPADHIRAEWMFESFARAVADVGAAFIIAERRLADLSAANLLMASTGGLIAGTAMIGPDMTVLESDPGAAGPRESGITVAPDWQQLAEEFRGYFTALIDPMVDWMVRHRLRQEKALWSAAADRLAQALIWSGAAFDQPDFARELTVELLDRPGPLAVPLEITVDDRGREHHRRVSCCLAYRAAGGGFCHACPLNEPSLPAR